MWSITVDEMFGDKKLAYSDKEKRNVLVGVEFLGDGKVKFVRVTRKDSSPGETFSIPLDGFTVMVANKPRRLC